MPALLPAFLAALFAVWCGNLSGGATAAGAAAAALVLLGAVAAVGVPGGDPLRLGRAGRLLPPALWLAAAGSLAASPVPRAGRVGIALLPAFLALPAAVARCWGSEETRRRGTRALAAIVGAAALFALAAAFASPVRPAFPALPLGHRNLLAAWLAILLPLSLLPAREPGRWRWLGVGAGLAALAALLAGRSLLGFLAAAAEAGVGLAWTLRGRKLRAGRRPVPTLAAILAVLLALLLSIAAALQARRLADVALGRDPSERTRAVYYAAGLRGALARPALGWGPGATPWTIARFLVPIPGLNPPGEIVPDLHSLPLALAYELGAPGLLLALSLAGLFARRRLAELPAGADPGLAAAGLAGLLGGAVTALGSAAVGVAALPLAAALAAGAALAGARSEGREPERAGRLAPSLYALAALAVLAPLVLAERAYERAGVARGPLATAGALQAATDLDPDFPLYRARLAWLAESAAAARPAFSGAPVADPAAALARRAAARGDRLAPLWLQAGVRGLFAGRPWAPDALRRACVLDPLSPFAPFFLAVAAPESSAAPALAARALLAEPRLAAATFWRGREALLARAVAKAAGSPGVDPGWRRSLAEQAARLPADDGERAWLAFAIDEEPALSLSLNAFRRRPWPARWPLVEVRAAAARALRLPSAARLPSTSPEVFRAAGCSE